MSGHGIPYWRLGGFYFLWFGALGALLPYWGLYLRDGGYSAAAIGLLFAILLGTKIVAPNVWGWVADRTGRRLVIIRIATAAAAATFVWVPFADGFIALALLMAAYGFFSNASLPQFEAVTFNHLGALAPQYGRIRLWGSLGFIASVASLGMLLTRVGMGMVPWWILAALVGLFLVCLSVPEAASRLAAGEGDRLGQVLRKRPVQCLLTVCFLAQFSHGAYYVFFSIYLADHGYGRSLIGLLWAFGVLAEVAVFIALPWLLARIGLRQLMLAAMVLTALRWSLLAAFPGHLGMVVLVQSLHLASFGLYHVVAVNLIHRMFRGRLQGRGQALYSSLSFGAGGAAGALVSGLLWGVIPHAGVFVIAAAVAGLAWLIAWLGLRSTTPLATDSLFAKA